MHDNESFYKSSLEGSDVSIAIEAQSIVHEAAGDTAGLTIKGQLRKAARALGYPDGHWRVRAAWYSEAGCWSAVALEDLRGRYRAWSAKQAALAEQIDLTHAALLRAGATALESSHAAIDRRQASEMVAHADTLELSRSRHRSEAD